MLITKKQVENFLIENNVYNFKINKNLVVNVFEDVDIRNCCFITENLPVRFGKVYGSFDISSNDLITLKGCPEYVAGHFDCSSNSLKNLKYGPKFVGGEYQAHHNEITSLMYLPKKINNFVNFFMNNIEDIDFFDYEVTDNVIDLESYSKGKDEKLLKNIGYIECVSYSDSLTYQQKDIYNHWKINQERELFSKELACVAPTKRSNKI